MVSGVVLLPLFARVNWCQLGQLVDVLAKRSIPRADATHNVPLRFEMGGADGWSLIARRR